MAYRSCGYGSSVAEAHDLGCVPVREGAGNNGEAPAVAMTVESVDAALEEVRPYLIADGGNVTVAAVEGGIVMLQLEVGRPAAGFPSSCPASPFAAQPPACRAGSGAVTETNQSHGSSHRIGLGSLVGALVPSVPSESFQFRDNSCVRFLIAGLFQGAAECLFRLLQQTCCFTIVWRKYCFQLLQGCTSFVQGACGTCPSSTATMKMGIERALKVESS